MGDQESAPAVGEKPHPMNRELRSRECAHITQSPELIPPRDVHRDPIPTVVLDHDAGRFPRGHRGTGTDPAR